MVKEITFQAKTNMDMYNNHPLKRRKTNTNNIYRTKIIKINKYRMRLANIYTKIHLFDDIRFRCLRRAVFALSTFANDSSMLSSMG